MPEIKNEVASPRVCTSFLRNQGEERSISPELRAEQKALFLESEEEIPHARDDACTRASELSDSCCEIIQGLTNPAVMPRVVPKVVWLPEGATPIAPSRLSTLGSGNDGPDNPPTPSISERISNQNETQTTNTQTENLSFHALDSAQQSVSVPHSTSPISATPRTWDSMESVTRRPIKIASIPWEVGGTLEIKLNPWKSLLSNPVITNRLQYFRFFRASVKIQVLIDGTAFHSGLAWLTYTPLRSVDEMTQYEATSVPDLVEMSQRPRLTISPRESQGGMMYLPFIYQRDYADLTSNNVDDLGELYLRSIVPLTMGNGGTQSCRITILASLCDVETHTPTNHENLSNRVKNQGEDVPKSTISGSPDRNLLSSKSGVNSDPSTMWGVRQSTRIADLGGIEAYVGSFIWGSSSAVDSVLYSLRCSPFHGIQTGSGPTLESHVTPAAWLALPFTFWRGTVSYRFEIVASSAHRGKIMFSWDPLYTRTKGEYNKNYSTVMDIGTNNSHVARIGWGQDRPYLPCITGMSQLVNQSLKEYTTTQPYANGVLTVSTFSPLMIPNGLVDTNVTILVYAKMMPDYELVLSREPLTGTLTQKNNTRQDTAPPVPNRAPPPETEIPVANPTLSTVRVLDICEWPLPAGLRKNTKFISGTTVYPDPTWPGALADITMERVKMGSEDYELAQDVQYSPESAFVLRARGFVEGETKVDLTVVGRGPGNVDKYSAVLSGITANTDIIVLPTDGRNNFVGNFNISATNQFQGVKFIYKAPKWAANFRRAQPLGLEPDLRPTVNWYGNAGNLLVEQEPFARSNVFAKFRITDGSFPAPVVVSNYIITYIGTSPPGNPITLTSRGGTYAFPSSFSGEVRHAGVPYDPEMRLLIPSGAEISILRVGFYQVNETATRDAIKSQPLVVNQNDSQQGEDCQYGPDPIPGVSSIYFQEVVTDILQPLRVPHSALGFISRSQPGVFFSSCRLEHFPFQYRTPSNTDTISSFPYPHLLDYFGRAFIAIRGSMKMMIDFEARANVTASRVPWAKVSKMPIDRFLTLAEVGGNPRNPGFQGSEWFNTFLTSKLELDLPWFYPFRFALARSTLRSNHAYFAYRLETGGQSDERGHVHYSIGDDLTMSHFLCTPVLRAA